MFAGTQKSSCKLFSKITNPRLVYLGREPRLRIMLSSGNTTLRFSFIHLFPPDSEDIVGKKSITRAVAYS